MKAHYPKPPSQRDQDIYRLTVIGARTQTEVADLYEITPGRVSQVCTRVREWLTLVSGDESSLEQELFIASRETRHRLAERLHDASQVFGATCQATEQTKVVRRDHDPRSVERVETITRSGRPSAAMFRELVRLEDVLFAATERECILKAQMLRNQAQSRWWRDEEKVQRCVSLCRQLVLRGTELFRNGEVPPRLPSFALEPLTASIRARVTSAVDGSSQGWESYLPDDWAAAARQMGMLAESPPADDVATETATAGEAEVTELARVETAESAVVTAVEAPPAEALDPLPDPVATESVATESVATESVATVPMAADVEQEPQPLPVMESSAVEVDCRDENVIDSVDTSKVAGVGSAASEDRAPIANNAKNAKHPKDANIADDNRRVWPRAQWKAEDDRMESAGHNRGALLLAKFQASARDLEFRAESLANASG